MALNNNEESFLDVIYYDGVKLQVNLNNNTVLAWYDSNVNDEEWFYIKANKNLFEQYLSNKTTLLDIVKNSDVSLVNRKYENYNTLDTFKKINDLNQYELPDDDSYLGFDFTRERGYLGHLMKGYKHNDVLSRDSVSNIRSQASFNYASFLANDTVKVGYEWERNTDAA